MHGPLGTCAFREVRNASRSKFCDFVTYPNVCASPNDVDGFVERWVVESKLGDSTRPNAREETSVGGAGGDLYTWAGVAFDEPRGGKWGGRKVDKGVIADLIG